MRQVSSFGGVRQSFLLSEIEKLGKVFPAAREALLIRRDAAQRQLAADTKDADFDAIRDFSSINRVLGESARTLALFDSLPADDQRRAQVVFEVADQLLESRRYQDLVSAQPYDRVVRLMDLSSATLSAAKPTVQALAEKRWSSKWANTWKHSQARKTTHTPGNSLRCSPSTTHPQHVAHWQNT